MTTIQYPGGSPIFLGLADFLQIPRLPYPYGGIDLFQLSQHKGHIIYPAATQGNVWVLLVSTKFLTEADLSQWEIRVVDESDVELGKMSVAGLSRVAGTGEEAERQELQGVIAVPSDSVHALLHFNINAVVSRPGRYTVESIYAGSRTPIGKVHFHYKKANPLTPDQIKAIASDPNSVKAIRIELGCKHCPTKMKAYTGLRRSHLLERDKWLWQTDLPNVFLCQCRKTQYSLEYLKESMHGLLLKDISRETGLSYVRRYAHSQIMNVVEEYTKLLNKATPEEAVQKYIEDNPVLLSAFHAKRLFLKPTILGRFTADFAVVDSQDHLWFIELERPNRKLFRRDGHPTRGYPIFS